MQNVSRLLGHVVFKFNILHNIYIAAQSSIHWTIGRFECRRHEERPNRRTLGTHRCPRTPHRHPPLPPVRRQSHRRYRSSVITENCT